MRNSMFRLGNFLGTFFYLILCIIALCDLSIYENISATLRVVTIILVAGSLVVLVMMRKSIPEYRFIRLVVLQFNYFLIASLFVFESGNSRGYFWVIFVESLIIFSFMEMRIYIGQIICITVSGLFLIFCPYQGHDLLAPDRTTLLGMGALIGIQLVCMSIMTQFLNQTKWLAEQERTMENMLRIVETKCREAQAATKSKSRFLSNMSHEIRTPINSILGMNELILRESSEPAIHEYAENIDSSGHMLLSLINEVLDFSKIESGKMELNPIEYQLSSLVNDLVAMMTQRVQEKDLTFHLEIDERLPSVYRGDEIRIRQILANIFTNAVKYTKEGSITLSVSGRVVANKAFLHFEVIDTGVGIAPDDLPKLFEAFARFDAKENARVEGTGLGMTITNQLLEMMGSHLGVKSEKGVGSNFFFTVKQDVIDKTPIGNIQEQVRKAKSVERKQTMVYAPEARTLVVDDNDMNRKVFRNLLKRTGIQVWDASSGEECLELVKQQDFDVIFMDHMMPGMDGIETFHVIRGLGGKYTEIPVIALTANAVSGAREMYLAEGFSGFLAKPIMPDKLELILREFIPERLLQDPPEDEKKKQKKAEEAVPAPAPSKPEMPAVDGLDWNLAWLHFTDEEMLRETIENFYFTIGKEADQLDSFYDRIDEEGMMKEYRILVHSMKSSANLVGIFTLGGAAKILENAAAAEDADTIRAMHKVFVREWRGYREKLQVLMPEQEKSEDPFDADAAKEILQRIREAAETLDVDTIDDSVASLRKLNFPWDAGKELDDLSAAATDLDIDSMTSLCDTLSNRIGEFA